MLLVCFLCCLPQMVRESLWKAIGMILVVCLISLTLYLYNYTSLSDRPIQLPALIAYALLYIWKGGDYLKEYRHKHQHLLAFMLNSVLAIICLVLAGWYVLEEVLVTEPSHQGLLPLALLISLYSVLIGKERSTTQSKAA
jgi:hypothetical protein